MADLSSAALRPILGIALSLLAACGQGPGTRLTSDRATPEPGAGEGAADASEVVVRRVWAEFGDPNGSPSPDGRFISFTDWETGDIALRDLRTGEHRRLTHKGSWSESDEQGEFPVISRDGRFVAYAWSAGRTELRVVGMDGTGVRTVYEGGSAAFVEPHAWSPDGREILASVFTDDGSVRLALVPVSGGPARMIRSFDWRFPLVADFSPDGRFIAYDFPPDETSAHRDLYLLSLDGGREIRLTDDPRNEQLLGWAPDGSGIYFMRTETGSMAVWRLPMRDGRPAGRPTLVHADLWRSFPVGFSRNAYYYAVFVDQPQVYTAALDGGDRSPVDLVAPLAGPAGERALAPAWAPDGSRVAYVAGPPGRGPRHLVIRTETGEARQLTPRLQYIFRVAWAPDSRSLFVSARNRGRRGIFQVDLATAEARLVATTGSGAAFVTSPDGRTLYYSHEAPDGSGIIARDLESGRERLVASARPERQNLALSPDGRSLAFATVDHETNGLALALVAAAGGEPRLLHRWPEATLPGFASVQWSRDGQHILFATARREGGGGTIFGVPATGGRPVPLVTHPGNIWSLSPHPDGRRVAFQSGNDRAELWVMENLPGAAPRRAE